MCKFGYKVGCDGTCEVDASFAAAMELASNTTQEEKDELLAIQQMESKAIAFNVFMFTAWVSGFATVVGGAVLSYRKHMNGQREEEEHDYEKLGDGPALYE